MKKLLILFLGVFLIGSVSALYVDTGLATQSVNDCGGTNPLNTTGAIYTLSGNVAIDGTCLYIKANNSILDGAGYVINYSNSGTLGTGINITNAKNITVKNLFIRFGTSTTGSAGIVAKNSWNITALNNSINSSGTNSRGIYFDTVTDGMVLNNTINSSGTSGYGIYLYNSANSTVRNNTAKAESSALRHEVSAGNGRGLGIVDKNYLESRGSYSTIFALANSNLITNNSFISATYASAYGIAFTSNNMKNMIFIDNNVFVGGGSLAHGIRFDAACDNCTFSRMNLSISGGQGISIGAGISNMTFTDVLIYNTSLSSPITLIANLGNNNKVFLNFTNVSMADGSRVNVSWAANTNTTLNMMWWITANVSDSSSLANLADVNVSGYNIFNNFIFTNQTNADGTITKKAVLEYKQTNLSTVYYSNYTINATLTGYTTYQNTTINMSTNRRFDILLVSSAGTCTCPSINTNWIINDGSVCTLSTTCNIGTGKLRIYSGGLLILNNGKLIGATAYINNSQRFYVDNGGKAYFGT